MRCSNSTTIATKMDKDTTHPSVKTLCSNLSSKTCETATEIALWQIEFARKNGSFQTRQDAAPAYCIETSLMYCEVQDK